LSKQVKVPAFADQENFSQSHVPPGAVTVVNGVAYGIKEVPVSQTVNGRTLPAGTVQVPTARNL
jgi:hypothetical protein